MNKGLSAFCAFKTVKDEKTVNATTFVRKFLYHFFKETHECCLSCATIIAETKEGTSMHKTEKPRLAFIGAGLLQF